ncbi:unnamed protein product [Effrenium voratum]|uniref:Uncharacterized protein n=1 Tax=Effrenium voratum TaxID=2562239 RepID=A0AA36IFX0_9DINO|nr:unnamed protein product [Effrenium voratum]
MGKGEEENDASYTAHRSYYTMLKNQSFDIGILENVPEYQEAVVKANLPGWSVKSKVIDPRLFGQGASRPRRYFLVWNPKTVEWNTEINMDELLSCLLCHPSLTAESYFWMDKPASKLTLSQDFSSASNSQY